jgi:hypothetical protein
VGHQNALLAGLLAQIGKADAVISLDADLQDTSRSSAKGRPHYIVEQETGAAATRPEGAVARNRAEAFQPAENGYSRVTL